MSDRLPSIRLGTSLFSTDILDLPARGEDAYLTRDGFAGVADGATPLSAHAQSPADLSRRILSGVADLHELPIRQAVRAVICELADGHAAGADDPSASVAWVRDRAGEIELSSLSDCLGVIRLADGQIIVSERDVTHAALDAEVIERIGRAVRGGVPFAEARAAETGALLANRARMNTVTGYWVVANNPEAADHLRVKRVALDLVEAILLCSDGFSRLWDTLHLVPGPGELLAWAEIHGLSGLGSILRAVEAAPGNVELSPRFSIHDDATAILLRRNSGTASA